ncbi:MAG: CpsD/CapB family tyrosine-protein kinase [Vicinamibacterales bacterium]
MFESPWTVADGPAAEPRAPGGLLDHAAPPQEGADAQLIRFRGFSPAWADRLVVSARVDPVMVEQYRQLAATLHHAQTVSNIKVVMVTSAEPSEGKTLTAINLALILSESYRLRVLLIDADLRRPSMHDVSQVSNLSGLGDTLKATEDKKLTAVQLNEKLTLVPAGRPDPDPMSGLTSPRMQGILKEASERFDWVLLDSPPVAPIADAGLLASMVDGILFVVRAGRTRCRPVQHAIDALGRDRILGVVLNAADGGDLSRYGNYYDTYYRAHGNDG